ncbi:MAG: ABC transporter ATP-binding protein [Actinobacteria bacterium]|nr:ABC transporter ATP-binding protein [Actinomycetota bacterium]
MESVAMAKELVKEFKGVRALDGLSLEVPSGITYGLLGPNGAGKTTLIRILVGIASPTAGEAIVLGRRPGSSGNAREIGYMTQLPALYQDLSVAENLEFFAKVFGLEKKGERKQRIDEVLELVEMTGKQDSLVSSLSGGMKQRVSLACSLVHAPKLIFLDEPTVGVDPSLRRAFWDHFKRLNSEGVTIIVSSHVMDEAERCDRLGLLRRGRLLIEGSLSEILSATSETKLEEAFLALERDGLDNEKAGLA